MYTEAQKESEEEEEEEVEVEKAKIHSLEQYIKCCIAMAIVLALFAATVINEAFGHFVANADMLDGRHNGNAERKSIELSARSFRSSCNWRSLPFRRTVRGALALLVLPLPHLNGWTLAAIPR